MNQDKTPLLDTLLAHARRKVVSFHTPGHKNGRGIDKKLASFTGRNVFSLDVTVFPEVDSLHDPTGPIRRAQQLMARAYGVEQSFFLVNGSSVGNMAMIIAACRPGDSLILSRNAHKSILAGVILSGVWPIWIQPKIDQNLDIIFDSAPEQVEATLRQYPEAKAVFITCPTYNGVATNLKKIAEICRSRGKILLVDEAHGAHLHFHPDLPLSAVDAGADLVVQSTHKTLSAISQGSVLHFKSKLVDFSKLRRIVSMLQTTSPNYLTLASLDLARRQMVTEGENILSRLIQHTERTRAAINHLKNFSCFTRAEIQGRGFDLDVTKLTINVTRTGYAGQQISEILAKDFHIQVDAADLFNLIAICGTGTSKKDLDALVSALKEIDEQKKGEAQNWVLRIPSLSTELVMNPRDVFLLYRSKRVPLRKAIGHISAQPLTPYPPGIPVLIPGERITAEIVEYLEELVERAIRVSGQEAEYLKTVRVVALH
ncbi:MAG: aminotransferase class I/II-fold pyridoxal phosphate-dependent enzyme [Elusimicrobia bacterium]|nr:aminotransferase class I/II-fold pyridoxal phosphate-dependent enzyme [Candidatus Obscuribacterium magneticum]